MRSLGLQPTDKELADMVNEVDVDDTGTIDINEFLTMMSHVASPQDSEDELLQAFKVFDRDNSGTISISEMRDVLKALGEDLSDQDINEIMSAADSDGDRAIDCECNGCYCPGARRMLTGLS
jgi:calmodulin